MSRHERRVENNTRVPTAVQIVRDACHGGGGVTAPPHEPNARVYRSLQTQWNTVFVRLSRVIP